SGPVSPRSSRSRSTSAGGVTLTSTSNATGSPGASLTIEKQRKAMTTITGRACTSRRITYVPMPLDARSIEETASQSQKTRAAARLGKKSVGGVELQDRAAAGGADLALERGEHLGIQIRHAPADGGPREPPRPLHGPGAQGAARGLVGEQPGHGARERGHVAFGNE